MVIPKHVSRNPIFCGTSLGAVGFPCRAEVERSELPTRLFSCSSIKSASRLTCLTASKSTTTRARLSVITAAHSSGALHGRDWSVMVSPWCTWHKLSMGVCCCLYTGVIWRAKSHLAHSSTSPVWDGIRGGEGVVKRTILQEGSFFKDDNCQDTERYVVHEAEKSLPGEAKNISATLLVFQNHS